jgi:hypothetical protein
LSLASRVLSALVAALVPRISPGETMTNTQREQQHRNTPALPATELGTEDLEAATGAFFISAGFGSPVVVAPPAPVVVGAYPGIVCL